MVKAKIQGSQSHTAKTIENTEMSQINQADLKHILHLLSATNVSSSLPGTGWVQCSCPLKHWNHKNGDKHPSFGVTTSESGPPTYHCFGCGEQGSLTDLLLQLLLKDPKSLVYKRSHIAEAFKVLDKYENNSVTSSESWADLSDTTKKEVSYWPEEWLRDYPKIPDHPYLKSRGIEAWVADELDIRYDFQQRRVLFPIRSFGGKLVGARGRDVTDSAKLRYWPYRYNDSASSPVWLGESWVDFDKPVVLTESVFDLAKIYHVYKNVMAPLSASLSEGRVARISGADSYITFFDYGTAGNVAREKIQQFLKAEILHIVPDEEYDDAGSMPVSLIGDIVNQALKELYSGDLIS